MSGGTDGAMDTNETPHTVRNLNAGRRLAAVGAAAILGFGALAACSDDTDDTNNGDEMEEEMEDLGDDIEDGVEDGTDELEDGADELEDEADELDDDDS